MHEIPLMRSLDPHHARLGYLGVCATVGVRSLDTYDALISRIRDLLFERFYAGEPAFGKALSLVDRALVSELMKRRSEEDDPASILAPFNAGTEWITRSEAWLFDARMPSHLGYLKESHVGRCVDLARWTGVLLPTLDLSEDGLVLQTLIRADNDAHWRDHNLLLVSARPALVLCYMRLLLRSEVLFVSLLCEMAERTRAGTRMATRGPNSLLRHSLSRLRAAIGEPADPEDFLAFRAVGEFEDAFLKSLSTEENYFRPRVEMLVDLGLVSRSTESTGDKPGAFPWGITATGDQVARTLSGVDQNPLFLDEFLQKHFIRSMEPVIGQRLRQPIGPEEVLLWFARAYRLVHREIGFTPGRTVASLGSLLAAEAGVRIEMSEAFEVLYAVPQTDLRQFVSFSGGSRFDAEFMIRLGDDLVSVLEARIDHPARR